MSTAVGIVVFACLAGGMLLGMHLRRFIPKHHLNDESADVIKLATGIIGTMAALLLSLQLGTAWSSFETRKTEVTDISAKILLLDRTLASCGSEAQPVRDLLRSEMTRVVGALWSDEPKPSSQPVAFSSAGQLFYDRLVNLSPSTEAQRSAKSHALDLAFALGQTRWLIVAQESSYASRPVLGVLLAWLAVIFICFGLLSPRNATVMCALMICAATMAGAFFLILELYSPFTGLIRVSSEPLRAAIVLLGH